MLGVGHYEICLQARVLLCLFREGGASTVGVPSLDGVFRLGAVGGGMAVGFAIFSWCNRRRAGNPSVGVCSPTRYFGVFYRVPGSCGAQLFFFRPFVFVVVLPLFFVYFVRT